MTTKVRADKQLMIAAMGMGTTVLTAIILGFIQIGTGFALYSFMFWFIIPVGAILAGFSAASGYYFGAKLFHQRPAGGVALNMVLAAISAYLLVHYVPYYLSEVEGTPVKDLVSFWTYLDFDIRSTSLTFQGDFATRELGSIFGYIYAGLQLLGFSLGGLCVWAMLLDIPFCEKCEKYLQKMRTQDRYSSEGETLSDRIQEFLTKLENKKYSDALRFHAARMGDAKKAKNHLRTRITIHKCKSCETSYLDFEASRIEGNDWKEIDDVRTKVWIDKRSMN